MDGGVATLQPSGSAFQRSSFFSGQSRQAPPPSFVPSSQQPKPTSQTMNNTQVPVDPSKDPSQPGQVVMFDGKRMRKAVHRKTVDYNSAVIKYIENRVWQRDERDERAIMPDPLYQIDVTPPMATRMNPTNSVTTKFIRTSTNKFRCPIFCLAWTPEGRRLVTGASSGEFTLWNGLTFNFETILQAHDTSVRAMVWSNNDSWMVTGDHSGFIKYWQSNMNNVKMFQGHKEPVRGISFAPSDNKFTTCSDDGTVRIWDFQKCQEEKILRGHGADVKCVGWHPHKSLIASGSKDNQQPMKIWDAKSGQCLATLHAHKMTVMQLQWNKNGNWLLTASRDHLIKLFDIRNMKEEVQTFKGHKKEATAIDWHPIHEGLFVSGGSDGAVMFWHVGTDRELGGMETAHEGMVWSMAWHPLGHILATGSNDHTTKFWTRNRPGDRMRDKYNLNTLGGSEHEYPDIDIDINAPVVTQLSSIPGVNDGNIDDDSYLDKTDDDISIPGLDWESDSKFLKDHGRDTSQRRKIPYARPIDREFVHAWRTNKQPPAISGEKIEEKDKKPKGPLPSLLDLPSMKPSAEFDLDTLKDEEGDKHGQQLRQGRKEFMKDRRGGQDSISLDRDDRNDRDRGRDRDRRRDDRDRHRRHDSSDDEERMIEESLIDLQERLDRKEREKMDMDVDDRNMDMKPGMMGNQGLPGKVPLLGNQGLIGNPPMGNQQGMMGNNQGMMGNQQGMMGNNQKGMIGNNQGIMGNQQGMMGNNQGMMGNQQGMMGNNQGMMGNKPGLMGNQQGMMGNNPRMMGNQQMMNNQQNMMGQNRPSLMGNQPGMMGPKQGLMGNQPGMMGNQNNMMGQNRPGLMGNQMGMRGPNPGMMGNQMGGPMNQQGMMGNRMAGPQGSQRMPGTPLLGPAPGMANQGPGMGNQGGGPNMNRSFGVDEDFRGGPNPGPRGGGGPNLNQGPRGDMDFRNQDSDFRKKQDSDFRDNDMRRNRDDRNNRNNDRDNRFNRQEEMMDTDDRGGRMDRDDRRDNFGNRNWQDGGGGRGGRGGGGDRGRGGRGGGRGGRGGWRGGR